MIAGLFVGVAAVALLLASAHNDRKQHASREPK